MTGLRGTSSQAPCPGLGPTEERAPFALDVALRRRARLVYGYLRRSELDRFLYMVMHLSFALLPIQYDLK